MMPPLPITLRDLVDQFDVFFIDQFGVLRSDSGVYPGATDALSALKTAGKTVVILSNSGRSGSFNADRMIDLGFARQSFDHFVTSGDVAYTLLSENPLLAGARRCFTISSGGDTNLAKRLGLEDTADAGEADLVVISGSEAERIPLTDYQTMLQPAAARALPCYCTNPDIHKLWKGALAPGAGAIADLYEALGGKVTRIGKPFPAIYAHAIALCGAPDRTRIVCIGDSIEHDIAGASGAGLASVLVETGILADATVDEKEALMARHGAAPTFTMPRLCLDRPD